MGKFVVLVDEATTSQRDAITSAIKDEGVAWWHWIQYAWLVKDRTERDPAFWRELVKAAAPGVRVVILQVDPINWGCWMPSDAHKWLRETWTTE
jgi:hypothetical protein